MGPQSASLAAALGWGWVVGPPTREVCQARPWIECWLRTLVKISFSISATPNWRDPLQFEIFRLYLLVATFIVTLQLDMSAAQMTQSRYLGSLLSNARILLFSKAGLGVVSSFPSRTATSGVPDLGGGWWDHGPALASRRGTRRLATAAAAAAAEAAAVVTETWGGGWRLEASQMRGGGGEGQRATDPRSARPSSLLPLLPPSVPWEFPRLSLSLGRTVEQRPIRRRVPLVGRPARAGHTHPRG